MAIQHMDDWSIYGRNISLMTNGVYAQVFVSPNNSVSLVSDPDGTSAGTVLRMASILVDPGLVRYVWPTPQTTLGQACRIWLASIPSVANGSTRFFEFRNAANTALIYGKHNTVGGITIYNGSDAVIGTTTGPVVTANAWWHHEVKVDFSAGTCEVRIEGVPVQWTAGGTVLTGLVTTGGPFQQVAIYGDGGNYVIEDFFKDLVWWDGTGSHNNNFLGAVIVYSMTANGDVTVPWTITGNTTGTAILNNAPPIDASQYLAADSPSIPAQMVYNLGNLPANVTTVRGLMTFIRAKKVDGGDGNLQNGLLSGATQGNGTNRPISASFTYYRDVFETDPATTNSWTVAAANAAQMTMNRTV